MANEHRFPYEWIIADGYPAKGIESHKKKVFGTFICGGGSSMGYKLAGYDHLGGVEIDERIAAIYQDNHHPKFLFKEDLRIFNERQDLPAELYNLDLLDGSPPCSTFSMAGSREDAWGKKKQFAEGQAVQTLDDLVFIYCDTILKLMPKCFLLENVKGLTTGNAKSYLLRVLKKLDQGGYKSQVFVLNAATMGVPQKRERTFIIGHKKEFDLPKLVLNFNEKPIFFKEVIDKSDMACNISELALDLWKHRIKTDKCMADINARVYNRHSRFTETILHSDEVCPTVTTKTDTITLYDFPRKPNKTELKKIGTFPQDYKCDTFNRINWLIGMSVPPVMTANVAYEIYQQWLKNI